MKEPKLKYKVDFKELKELLDIPVTRGIFKKGDIVELIDEKNGISRKCKIKKVYNMDNNPHYFKAHSTPGIFEYIELKTK